MSGFTEIEHHVLCDIIHSPFGLYVFDPHHFYSGLLCHLTKSFFAKDECANQFLTLLEIPFGPCSTCSTRRTIALLFVVPDSCRIHQDEMLLPTSLKRTFSYQSVIVESFKSSSGLRPIFRLKFKLTFSRCGTDSAILSRCRRCLNLSQQVSMRLQKDSGLGLFPGQRVSPRSRSDVHLVATLENSTPRHFDLNLLLRVSLR